MESWQRVHSSVEVILYGDGQGVAEAAARHGAAHVPKVACSGAGAPLFNAIAEHAREHARHDRQIYLNADIILPPDLLAQIEPVKFPKCLISGQRIDLAEGVNWQVGGDWRAQLDELKRAGKAQPHLKTGMDYFIFPSGLWDRLEELTIGRGGYDNALLAFCLRSRIPVVDATCAVTVLHQWHGYSHIPGGLQEAHRGQEARQNCARHDVTHSPPDIADADWVLVDGGLRPGNCRGDYLRFVEVWLRYRHKLKRLSYFVRGVWRLLSRTGRKRVEGNGL